jgi:hypothetical protein
LNLLGDNLAEIAAAVKGRMPGGMRSPNLFLVPRDGPGPGATALGAMLRACLDREFPTSILHIAPADGGGRGAGYLCLAVDSSRPERVRDAIKERLWRLRPSRSAPATFDDLLRGRQGRTSRDFRLEEYGFFVPCRTRRFAGVRTHSFQHEPGFYRYRLALARVAGLPEPMADFLQALFTNCPNHLFQGTVFRASRACRSRLGLKIPLTRVSGHGISTLASRSCGFRDVSSRHENLQKFFLAHDPRTVACEVPVWMESREFEDYLRVLGTVAPLTGHIDVLRREDDGRLGVWDYKPQAAAERNAHLQVFLYTLMLSLRTGLPLSAFFCGYFDEEDVFVFSPAQAKLAPE